MKAVREILAGITTVSDMVAAFHDEERCRRLLEAMIWPRGRLCPWCGCRDSIALAGRDVGRKARPGRLVTARTILFAGMTEVFGNRTAALAKFHGMAAFVRHSELLSLLSSLSVNAT